MITLKVEDYCHDCPDFEPDVEKEVQRWEGVDYDTMTSYDYTRAHTTIYCKHRYRCESVKSYLERQKKEEEKKDD